MGDCNKNEERRRGEELQGLGVTFIPRELNFDEGRHPRGRRPPRKNTRAEDWGLEKFMCVICKKPYQTVTYLQKHMVAKHRVCEPVVQAKCDFCGCTFSEQGQFELHLEGAHAKLGAITGVVAQMQQKQADYSRLLRNVAREDVLEDGRRNREVLDQNFNYVQYETTIDNNGHLLL